MKQSLLRNSIVTLASFILVITAVSAWTTPTTPPPPDPASTNAPAPITVSSIAQIKTGGLGVGSLVSLGSVQVGNTASVCTTLVQGAIRWTGTVMEYCNGTAWMPFGSGSGSGDTYFTRFTYTAEDGFINCFPFGGDCTYDAVSGQGKYKGHTVFVQLSGDLACSNTGGTCSSVGYGSDQYAMCGVNLYQYISDKYSSAGPLEVWKNWAGMGAQCVKSGGGGGGGSTPEGLQCQTVSKPWGTLTNGQVVSVTAPAGYLGVSCNGDYYDNNGGGVYHGYAQGSFSSDRKTCSWTVNDNGITEGSVKGEFCKASGGGSSASAQVNKQRKVFYTSTDWVVPAGVTTAEVTMVGGGGSGVGYRVTNAVYTGHSGGYVFSHPISLVPGETVHIEVGKGGKGYPTVKTSTVADRGDPYYVYVAPSGDDGLGGYPGTSSKITSPTNGTLLECSGGSGAYVGGIDSYTGEIVPGNVNGASVGSGRPAYSSPNRIASGQYAVANTAGACGSNDYGRGVSGENQYGVSSGIFNGGQTPFRFGSGGGIYRSGCHVTTSYVGTCVNSQDGRDGVVMIDYIEQ